MENGIEQMIKRSTQESKIYVELAENEKYLFNKLFKMIQGKVLLFGEKQCKLEVEELNKFYELKEDDGMLYYVPKNPEIENNKVYSNYNRCLDRFTGINKAIHIQTTSIENLDIEFKGCLKHKIKIFNDENTNSSQLEGGVRQCVVGYYQEMAAIYKESNDFLTRLDSRI